MKLSRVLAPIVAATVILTGCGGPHQRVIVQKP